MGLVEVKEIERLKQSNAARFGSHADLLKVQKQAVLDWLDSLGQVSEQVETFRTPGNGPLLSVIDWPGTNCGKWQNGVPYVRKQVEKWWPNSPATHGLKYPTITTGKKRNGTPKPSTLKQTVKMVHGFLHDTPDRFVFADHKGDLVVSDGSTLYRFYGVSGQFNVEDTERKFRETADLKSKPWIKAPVELTEYWHALKMAKAIDAEDVWLYRNPDDTLGLIAYETRPDGCAVHASVRFNTKQDMRFLGKYDVDRLLNIFETCFRFGYTEAGFSQIPNWATGVVNNPLLVVSTDKFRVFLAPMRQVGVREADKLEKV